jgi:hypothetical protein
MIEEASCPAAQVVGQLFSKQRNPVMKYFRVSFVDRYGYVQVHNVAALTKDAVAKLYSAHPTAVIRQKRIAL